MSRSRKVWKALNVLARVVGLVLLAGALLIVPRLATGRWVFLFVIVIGGLAIDLLVLRPFRPDLGDSWSGRSNSIKRSWWTGEPKRPHRQAAV
jgi:hypothetical protein